MNFIYFYSSYYFKKKKIWSDFIFENQDKKHSQKIIQIWDGAKMIWSELHLNNWERSLSGNSTIVVLVSCHFDVSLHSP